MVVNITTPTKTSSVTLPENGLFLGEIKQSDSNGVFVEIPKISPGFSFGPCIMVSTNYSLTLEGTTSIATTGNSTVLTNASIEATRPNVGTKVLCGFLNNSLDEVVILGTVL